MRQLIQRVVQSHRRSAVVSTQRAVLINHQRRTNNVLLPLKQQQFRFASTNKQSSDVSSQYFGTPSAPEYPQGKSTTFKISVPPVDRDRKIVLDKIVRNNGEFVEEDDIVCVLNVDGHKVEITTPEGAFLRRMYHKEGDILKSGDVLSEMAYSTAGDVPGSSPYGAAGGPVEQMRGVANDMVNNPIKMKKTVESFARASSMGWSLIGGAVVLGILLNWMYKKYQPETQVSAHHPSKQNTKQTTSK
jgi:biotin carboxyl carrier protein